MGKKKKERREKEIKEGKCIILPYLLQTYYLPCVTFFFFLMFYCLFLRDRETEHEWGRGRERRGQNLNPGSKL